MFPSISPVSLGKEAFLEGMLVTRRCFGLVACRSEHPVPLSLGVALVLFLYILFA